MKKANQIGIRHTQIKEDLSKKVTDLQILKDI